MYLCYKCNWGHCRGTSHIKLRFYESFTCYNHRCDVGCPLVHAWRDVGVTCRILPFQQVTAAAVAAHSNLIYPKPRVQG